MATLYQHLAATPRRMLLAIARARSLRIPWEAPKATLVELLADALADADALGHVVQALPEAERAALEDLLAMGGRMPRRHLVHRYGELRPYRPWRPDAPRRPSLSNGFGFWDLSSSSQPLRTWSFPKI